MQEGLEALPRLAREAVRASLEGREPVAPPAEGPLARAAPVFVTLRIGPELRGCMGALVPQHSDLVAETMDRARVAAFGDPRFPPLTAEELPHTSFEVTILEPLEPVGGPEDLDPSIYGVEIVDAAGRRAVLLPGIEGVDTVARQVELVRRKAGIPRGAAAWLRRFRVLKIEE